MTSQTADQFLASFDKDYRAGVELTFAEAKKIAESNYLTREGKTAKIQKLIATAAESISRVIDTEIRKLRRQYDQHMATLETSDDSQIDGATLLYHKQRLEAAWSRMTSKEIAAAYAEAIKAGDPVTLRVYEDFSAAAANEKTDPSVLVSIAKIDELTSRSRMARMNDDQRAAYVAIHGEAAAKTIGLDFQIGQYERLRDEIQRDLLGSRQEQSTGKFIPGRLYDVDQMFRIGAYDNTALVMEGYDPNNPLVPVNADPVVKPIFTQGEHS